MKSMTGFKVAEPRAQTDKATSRLGLDTDMDTAWGLGDSLNQVAEWWLVEVGVCQKMGNLTSF
jgi:hypothetical protein